MYTDLHVSNIVDSVIAHALNVWDEVKIISKYKNGRHSEAWQTYTVTEQAEIQCRLAIAWMRLGLTPGDRVAIMASNRPRWIFTINSLLAARLAAVPVYPTLTADEAAFILRHSGACYAVVDTLSQAAKIASVMRDLPDLRAIYIMDKLEEPPVEPARSFDSLLESVPEPINTRLIYERARRDTRADTDSISAASPVMDALCDQIRRIEPEDTAVIIYTSGTTGTPKGVMLSHNNFFSQRPIQKGFNIGPTDIFLNHLPFSHSFGLTADLYGAVEMGATLVIADGIQPEQIRHALQTIRPTVLMSVPRFFEKIYMQVLQATEHHPKAARRLIDATVRVGNKTLDLERAGLRVPAGLRLQYRLSRRIAKKILRRAGLDRVTLAYAGGAPISEELCLFFQGLGIPIYQGYGLTETSPVVTVNPPGRNKPGTVGMPIDGVEIKTAEDGEILVRGSCVMKGYFKDPAETARVIEAEGWFHTGDIGAIDQDGYLRILDRKKELIITSAGKNIAPIAVESAFNTDKYIDRLVLIGEGRNYLSALVFPNFDPVREWAASRGVACHTHEELVAHPMVRLLFEERISRVNKNLARFEQIKKFAVLDHAPGITTGELTPTEKIKRRVIAEKYQDVIDSLYA